MTDSGCNQIFHDPSERTMTIDCIVQECDIWIDDIARSLELFSWLGDNAFDTTIAEAACAHVDSAISFLEKFETKIIRVQSWYRRHKLVYYAKINKTGNLKRKLLPMQRELPKAHTEIWDYTTQKFRKCVTIEEEREATRQYHGRWMNSSDAKENCAFAKVSFHGKGGARGVILNSRRRVRKKDIKNLVFKGKTKMSKEIRKAYLDAHNGVIKELFNEPKTDNKLFDFPFFLTNAQGSITKEKFLYGKFTKALISIPGKARFDGFHLAVLGRFNKIWRDTTLNIIKLTLLIRYMPTIFKNIARIPIP